MSHDDPNSWDWFKTDESVTRRAKYTSDDERNYSKDRRDKDRNRWNRGRNRWNSGRNRRRGSAEDERNYAANRMARKSSSRKSSSKNSRDRNYSSSERDEPLAVETGGLPVTTCPGEIIDVDLIPDKRLAAPNETFSDACEADLVDRLDDLLKMHQLLEWLKNSEHDYEGAFGTDWWGATALSCFEKHWCDEVNAFRHDVASADITAVDRRNLMSTLNVLDGSREIS